MKRLLLAVLALGMTTTHSWSDPITVKGRYFEFATAACPGADDCSLIGLFKKVPDGKALIITQASCLITVTGAAKISQAFLAAKLVQVNAPVRIHYVVPTLVASQNSGKSYSFNQQVLVPLRSKEAPFVAAVANENTDIAMACSISGELLS